MKTPEMEKKRMLKVLETVKKKFEQVVISSFQKQMILGSLMGDMNIMYPNPRSRFPRIRVLHGSKQLEYVMWKYSVLRDITLTPPKTIPNAGFGEYTTTFTTRCLPCLIPIYDITMSNSGKKKITTEWLDALTDPVALECG